MKLEKRTVLSVNGTFVAGTLNVDITAGGTETASLRPELDSSSNQTGNFFLDENDNGVWDSGSEVRDAFTNLRQVVVNGFNSAGPLSSGGTFNWFGDFSTAPLNMAAVDVIDINNVANANFDSSSTINANGSVNIDAVNTTLAGSLSLATGGSLTVADASPTSTLLLTGTSVVTSSNQINFAVGSFDQDAGATLTATNDINIEVDTTATIDGLVRSTTGSIFVESMGSGVTMGTTGELIANVGSVKMQATAAGADIVADSITAGRDILVRAGDDITLNGPITSDTGANAALFDGHIEINAGDTLTSSAAVTAVDGSVNVRGTSIDLLDGGDLNSNLGLYVEASGSISIASDINAQQAVLIRNGAVTVTATGSVVGANIGVQTSSLSLAGTIDAAGGVAVAAGSVTMTGNAVIDGTSVVIFANNNIALGRVVATNTNIFSDSGSITDNNGAALNVQASTLGMVASQGSIGASDLLGTPDLNPNAIDIQVGTLSANARNGMYFQQSTGNLTIESTPRVGAGAAPVFFRVPFIGPATTGFGNFGLDIGGGSDLTAGGPIKVKVDAGTLTVTDGTDANGIGVTTSSGDILLWGENGVGVQARVVATNGDITFRSNGAVDITAAGSLQAGDTGLILANSLTYAGTVAATNGLAIQTVTDLTINSAVTSTSGSIALISTAGNVIQNINMASAADFYVGAAQNYTMAAGTTVAATGNAVIDAGGNVNLRQVTAADVAIDAGGDILDADADDLANVIAATAILNAGGSIGANNAAVNPASANVNALDTRVTTLSSRSGTQTFIREDNLGIDLTIGPVNAISANIASIKEVKFNSSNPAMTLTGQQTNVAAQEGVEAGGALRIVAQGILEINDGADAGNDAIVAGADILLRSASNIFLNADVRNTAGNIEIDGSLNVRLDNTTLTAATGTAYIHSNNVNLLSTSAIVADQDVYVTAVATVTLNGDVTSTNGQTQIQGTTIQQGSTSVVDGDEVFLFSTDTLTLNGSVTASGNIVLDTGRDLNMTGSAVSSGGNVFANVARDAFLGRLEGNQVTVRATNNILDNNAEAANIVATSASLFATNGTIGAPDAVVVPLNNLGSLDLQVGTLAATANGSIYLEELAAGGSLTIGGVAAASTTITSEVGVVSFNGSNLANLSVSRSFNSAALSDVQSTTGAVYLRVNDGGLTVTDGADADSTGIQAVGEVRIRTSGDITVNSGITSTTSRVTAVSTAGNAVVNGAVTANGATLVEAAQDVTIANQVRSNGGDLTIFAGDDIAINFTAGNALESAGGSLLLFAQNQSNTGNDGIVMSSGSSVAGGTGDVAFAAFNNSNIQLARASGNDVGLFAAGSILDANDDVVANTLNIVATGAVLQANNAIGTADTGNLSPNDNRNAIDLQVSNLAVSVTNSVYLREVDGLTTAAVNASTNRVNQVGGSAFAGIAFSGVSSSNGAIKLQSVTSDIEVSTQVRTNGASNILLETLANDGDIVINQIVTSAGGDVSIRAGDDIDLNANVSTSGLGSIHLLAANNKLDAISGVDMNSGTTVSALGGGVRIVAQNGGDILLSRVNATSVSLNASNSIIDNNDAVTPNTLNIQASSLQMVATNGLIGNSDVGNATDSNTPAIDTQVTTLAAQAALGIYVREVDGVTVDSVTTTISDVFFNSTEAPVIDTREDLSTTNNGPIKLQSVAGEITINAGLLGNAGISANGTGDVLLQTLATDGDITINGAVVSATGDIFARANDDLFVNANITTALPGTIHLLAANNTAAGLSNGVIMSAPSTVEATNSSVRIAAPNGGGILLSRVNASSVSLNAVLDILDNNGNSLNVQANVLRAISTSGAIGAAEPGSPAPDLNGNAIDTQVTTLAASARTGVYIQEADGVTVDSTGNVAVRIVFFNSTESNVTDASIEDLRTTVNGPIKLQSVTGDITINAGPLGNPGISANGTGDVLLQTLAADGDIVVNAEVISGTGDISIRSGDDIDLNANVTTSGLGSIHLLAANNKLDAISGVDMSSATTVSALGSGVRIAAQNGGDILLSRVNASSVSLNASNSIIDNNDAVTPNTLNIQASSLQMVATNGLIGNSDPSSTPAIDTQVTTLAARSALGIFVREVDGVTVDSVTTTVSNVLFRSTEDPVVDILEDLNTTNGGPVKLQTVNGNITINAGALGGSGVSANGSGDILLQAVASDGSIIISGAVTSTLGANSSAVDGHIEINAGDTVTSSAAVTAEDGAVYVRGTSINLLEGGDLNSNLGLFVEAGGSISIASDIDAEQDVLIRDGLVTVTATGSVVGANIGITTSSLLIAGTTDAINGVAVAAGSVTMTGNALIDGTSVAMFANNNIALGRVVATNTIIFSQNGSITDNNGAALNVQASTLGMAALQGSIGASDLPGTPDLNSNALDIQVGTLAANARNGMYFQQSTGNLTIGSAPGTSAVASPVFFRVPFNNASTTGFANFGLSIGGSNDLTASGPIKVKVDAGTLTVLDGTDADGIGVTTSSGDILLWGENGVNVQSRVEATNGDITFRSNGTVDINSNGSLQASDTGLILANSLNNTGMISAANGLTIQTVADLTVGGSVASTNGSIALISTTGSVNQNTNLQAGVDFYANAAVDYNMTASVSIDATGNAIVRAGNNLNLRLIQANNVALTASSIIDADADQSVNVVANDLIINASNAIGGSDPNPNADSNARAIDLDVNTISTRSGNGGTYLRQIALGGNILIGPVGSIATTIVTKEVKFNSSNPTFNLTAQPTTVAAQENAESSGVFKLVTENGSLNVNDGNDPDDLGVDAVGDILLETRNQAATGGDIFINARVRSSTGHVTLYAADDVLVNSTVSTAGGGSLFIQALNNSLDAIGPRVDGVNVDAALTTVDGDVLITSSQDIRQNGLISSARGDIGLVATRNLFQTAIGDVTTMSGDAMFEATNGQWIMDTDTMISVGGGDFIGQANDDINLGLISMTNSVENRVSLNSIQGSIRDGNVGSGNVLETVTGSNTSLSLRAGQRIGDVGGGGNASDFAIDLSVDTVAAMASSGVYLREIASGGNLVVDSVSDVKVVVDGVRRSRFDSSVTDVSQTRLSATLEDLATSNNGTISIVAENGTLTVRGGSDTTGISAHGTGDVFVSALNQSATGSDIQVNGGIRSEAGVIRLIATDDIHTTAEISNNGVGGIDLIARNNQTDATGGRVDGISLGRSVTTTSGNISFVSQADIDTTNGGVTVSGIELTVNSGGYTHLNNTKVSTLTAIVGRVGNLDGSFEQTNGDASNRGDDFLFGMNPRNATNGDLLPALTATDFQDNATAASSNYRFQDRLAERYALFIKNSQDLTIRSILANSSDAPHVYVETIDSKNLTVDGTVATVNTQSTNVGGGVEGAIVLVAGGEFELSNQGRLVTVANYVGGVRTQVINQIGPDGDTVLVTEYHGGEGAANFARPVSTRIVNPDIFGSGVQDNDPEIDAFQRVVLNYGSAGELGFDVYIAYADGVLQRFYRASDIGVVDDTSFDPNARVVDSNSYSSAPRGTPVNAFTRASLMTQEFVIDNTLLPTVVSVRRADDFFLFENASAVDTAQIRDLAVETMEILDVVSITAEIKALPLPEDVPLILPPVILVAPAPEEFVNVILPNSVVELTEIIERRTEISIYQVYFEDKDNDGYADDEELPKDSEIIEFAIIDGDEAKEKKFLEPKTRIKQGAVAAGFGSVTNQEIEAIKANFLKNPNQPTGAYAIIKKDALSNEYVLEVFSVRDGQEDMPGSSDDTPLLRGKEQSSELEKIPDDSSQEDSGNGNGVPPAIKQPDSDSVSQWNHSTGGELLAAAILLSRRKQSDSHQVPEIMAKHVSSSNRIDRSARRSRRIAKILEQTNLNR